MGGKNSPESINRYMQKAYDRLNVLVPKGRREGIKAAAAKAGESMNQYIVGAVDARMEQSSGETATETPQETAGQPTGVGVVSLPSETLEAAQRAAEAAGEALPMFIARAVSETAERDSLSQDS